MGCRRAHKLDQKKNLSKTAIDDSGQLSIDFLIGLSIFMLALIMVSTMASGLLVGLRSKTIDYDAVAYRTGVILVEDPGENTTFPGQIITDPSLQWEFVGKAEKAKVLRFGLSIYKSTPKILAMKKVESYSNQNIYDTLDDYRSRIIFGTYPYHFNITLIPIEGSLFPVYSGEPYNPYSSYGYIRRVVLIKTPGEYNVDLFDYSNPTFNDGLLTVRINSSQLFDARRGPIYWTDPMKEELRINLTNVSSIANCSPSNCVNLTQIAYSYTYYHPTLGWTSVGPIIIQPPSLTVGFNMTKDGIPPSSHFLNNINSFISTKFSAGYFIQKTQVSGNQAFIAIIYTFDPLTANVSSTSTISPLYTNVDPILIPAILEVRIW